MKKNVLIRLISVYEIVGGIIGIWVTINLFKQSYNSLFQTQNGTLILIMYIIIALLYITSVVSGILLWQNRLIGYIMSAVIQVIQVPYGVVKGFKYLFIAGIQAGTAYYTYQRGPNIKIAGFKNIFNFESTFSVFHNPTDTSIVLGINIIPVLMIILLIFRIRSDKKVVENN